MFQTQVNGWRSMLSINSNKLYQPLNTFSRFCPPNKNQAGCTKRNIKEDKKEYCEVNILFFCTGVSLI